ncbi:unnamed protein product [Amoebophrya sp. A25]|nr:unnamed protein product [Amoebophrya sp. A25]|eukprot:GSA25T00020056001.1
MVVPLGEEAIWPYFFFLIFISISALGLMNLVTVTVLDTALQTQREYARNADVDRKMADIKDLLQFPGETEVNTNRDYFIENWRKSSAFRTVFETLDLNQEDAGHFFDALDLDNSGSLDPFELSTTYMELTTSVLNNTAAVALVRSATHPDEKGKILRSTMVIAQASRFQVQAQLQTEEFRSEAKRNYETLNTSFSKAISDRAAMVSRMDSMVEDMHSIREELDRVKERRERRDSRGGHQHGASRSSRGRGEYPSGSPPLEGSFEHFPPGMLGTESGSASPTGGAGGARRLSNMSLASQMSTRSSMGGGELPLQESTDSLAGSTRTLDGLLRDAHNYREDRDQGGVVDSVYANVLDRRRSMSASGFERRRPASSRHGNTFTIVEL